MKKLMSDEALQSMLDTDLFLFTSNPEKNDNTPNTLGRALALLSLVAHENANPEGGEIALRVVEHLVSVTSANQAPSFDAVCLWNYCPFTASVAIAKMTPTVWSKLTQDTVERLTFLMEAYVYLESFATSDANSYSTGPGLSGNYHKGWNPNYRLANVPVMVFATHFFGDGDMKKGAKIVNDKLKAFDENAYQRLIDTFKRYGWERAYSTWTKPAHMHEDGTYGTDTKTVVLYGGPTYALDYTHTYVSKNVGDGLGVTNGGKDYTYHEMPLENGAGILEDLLAFNYSGGPVKSDHHYDVDKDGVAEKVAWIVDESISPYQGRLGMMKEFASGNRSSTGYCSHDFLLTTAVITAGEILGILDIKKNKELWEMIKVGNGDFFYKNEKGYQCFATGSYGTSTKTHSEADEGSSYFAMKSLWFTSLIDE